MMREPLSERFEVRLRPAEKAALERLAVAHERTPSSELRAAFAAWLAAHADEVEG